jgi:EpsI family protein
VRLYAAYYSAGEPGVKLASSGNAVFDAPWRFVGDTNVSVTIDQRSFRAHETRLHSAESSLVVWSWYAVDGTFTGNDYLAKLLLAKAKLSGGRQSSMAIAIATSGQDEHADAVTILKDFLSHVSFDATPPAGE